MRTALRSPLVAIVMAAFPLVLSAGPAAATGVKSSYDEVEDDPGTAGFTETGKLTVEVTGISQNWDDLEIQVNPGDDPADFRVEPNPPWSVDNSLVTRNGKKFLHLKRSSAIASDGTVMVFHNGKRRRGRPGTIGLTLNNQPFFSGSFQHTLATAAAGGGSCDHGSRPAATLLDPYFEVDLGSPAERTTLTAVTNASDRPVIARAMLWTDWGVPTLTFYVALSAGDVVTLNARDLMHLQLPDTTRALDEFDEPPPGCDAAVLGGAPFGGGLGAAAAALQADHTGQANPETGDCAGSDQGDGVARGYLIFDVVDGCAFPPTVATYDRPEWLLGPSAPPGGFYGATQTSTDPEDNVLTGDFFLVDPVQDFAVGEGLVPSTIPIELTELSLSSYTFYAPFSSLEGAIPRVPLDSLYRARYLNGGVFDGGTTLVVWRDLPPTGFERATCGELPSWAPLGEQSVVAWDEDESSVELPGGLGDLCPIADQALAYRCRLSGTTALPAPFGYLDIDLWRGDGSFAQGWVMPVLEAEGRFSVGNAATPLDDMCETPAPTPPVP